MNSYEKEHNEYIRKNASECVMFLNRNDDFPLSFNTDGNKIALFGNGARHTIKGGTGSGEVNSRSYVTIEQGLEAAGFQIITKKWLDAYDEAYEHGKQEFVKTVKKAARKKHTLAVLEAMSMLMSEPDYEISLDYECDTAIYVLARISGEGADRNPVAGDIYLTETEQRDILTLQEKYKKFLLVLNVGGVVDLSPIKTVNNILLLSQLGVVTGEVLADVLLGIVNPSGKLTTTWAAYEDYCAIGDFGDRDDTKYKEGIYVGYRYFDSAQKDVLYPFGYGLSYTTFEVKTEDVSQSGEHISINVSVQNVGKYPGKEVVQCYVSLPSGRLDQPYQQLVVWKKTRELRPGEKDTLLLDFNMTQLASYDMNSESYILEKGKYYIRIGTSSRSTEVVSIVRLTDDVTVKQVKACCGDSGFKDWKPDVMPEMQAELLNVPEFVMEKAVITTSSTDYNLPKDVDDKISHLSIEQLCYMNIGGFNPKAGIMNVIGDASSLVAGAAGETTRELEKEGIAALVMADGPAGLRLSKNYIRDEKGVHSLGSTLPATMVPYLPSFVTWFLNKSNKKVSDDVTVYEQYATAIPIGTAIAQSWNLEFAEACGDIVGDEMERFGVHLWLAPALNIHRTIRCGRNFEYYSEDPCISGRFAAAMTRGVHRHPTCSTTIKHFAANNQETNRYNNNSIVSERAMRDIYLKGFEICVIEEQPAAVMTSYNLLNGIHTSESQGLIDSILRAEWGFQGIVMTDWVVNGGTMDRSSVHPAPDVARVALAGGDLFMPGGKSEYKKLLKAARQGTISKEQLMINATRLYRYILTNL